MGRIILVTGGSRSGKSSFAQRLAEQRPGSRLFVATCPVTDKEMEIRILRHIRDRRKGNWDTVEEPVNLAEQIAKAATYDTVLIDCLTLWINNMMFDEASGHEEILDEHRVAEKAGRLVDEAAKHPGEVIMVTNEVGLGIVPENEMARRYRDLVGRCNQCVGRDADKVYLVICGIPMQIKDKNNGI